MGGTLAPSQAVLRGYGGWCVQQITAEEGICFWSPPPKGVIALEKLLHSWEANVEDFLCCTRWVGQARAG